MIALLPLGILLAGDAIETHLTPMSTNSIPGPTCENDGRGGVPERPYAPGLPALSLASDYETNLLTRVAVGCLADQLKLYRHGNYARGEAVHAVYTILVPASPAYGQSFDLPIVTLSCDTLRAAYDAKVAQYEAAQNGKEAKS